MAEEEKLKETINTPEGSGKIAEKKPASAERQSLPSPETNNSLLEKSLEQVKEDPDEKREIKKDSKPLADQDGLSGSAVTQLHTLDKRKQLIENILADGLEDIYLNLSDNKKEIFKKVGEETGSKINALLQQTKVNIKKIAQLIKKWLMIIPGVNLAFLEQEAKIKSDKIAKLKKES